MPRLLPIANASLAFTNVRLVATDMDGTLTQGGKFTSALLQGFQDLAAAGIRVAIVTGRSAGWVSGLAYYLPIVGAIAENGGLFFPNGSDTPVPLVPIDDYYIHRQQLANAFYQLKTQFPLLEESTDNRFRMTDWTFDVKGLNTTELQTLSQLCQDMGWGFTYSNVQCHIKPKQQDKAHGLLKVLQEYFPEYSPEQVVTVGDSPNDESLFDERYFPISVGVANVLEYRNQLKCQPIYVTSASEGEGFCELVSLLKMLKSNI